MNKLIPYGLTLILSLSMFGCKDRRTEYSKLKHENAVVTAQYHRNSSMYPMRIGKVTTMHHRPAINRTTFDGNIDFKINDRAIFERLDINDSVDLTYREVYRAVYDDTNNDGVKELISREFRRYEFDNAVKK